jgi:hypothetical protein
MDYPGLGIFDGGCLAVFAENRFARREADYASGGNKPLDPGTALNVQPNVQSGPTDSIAQSDSAGPSGVPQLSR